MTGPVPSAVVLAAGTSSRMGELKSLLDLGGATLLARAVGAFTAAGFPDVVVVTGCRGDEVAAAAVALGARSVANPRFEEGMYGSVQAGVAAVPEGRRFFLLPVDCPLVRPETLGRLARMADATGAPVVVPVHGEQPGHPPLLGAELRGEILAASPAGGLRELLASRSGLVQLVVDDPGVLHDADTPEALDALCATAAREALPSRDRCLHLLSEHGASRDVVAHSTAVASVAVALAAALGERQQHLCVPLVEAAALLHDVVRAQPRHADAGADLLTRLGYPRLAPVVRRHMALGPQGDDDLGEAQIVYLADKLVLGDRVVSLQQRFGDRLERVACDEAVRAGILSRLDEALRVRARVEALLGRPVMDVLAVAEPDPDARRTGGAA